jgi:protein associated with RNAse G/E
MSIKCLENISHDGIKYIANEIITNITKEEAERLIKLEVAVKIDSKFKSNRKDLKKVFANKYKRNKLSELEGRYEF